MTTASTAVSASDERHRVTGEQLIAKVKDLVRAGNTRRILVKSADGQTILEVPLTLGVAAAILEPTWVALAAIAALAADYTVERETTGIDATADHAIPYFRAAASTDTVGSAPAHRTSAVGPYVDGTGRPITRR